MVTMQQRRCQQVCKFYEEVLMIFQDCFVIGVKESHLCQTGGSEEDIIFYVPLPYVVIKDRLLY